MNLQINSLNYKKRIEESAIIQSLEIVRRRIDESGTKEPLIQRSGKNRILLQLPGVWNAQDENFDLFTTPSFFALSVYFL